MQKGWKLQGGSGLFVIVRRSDLGKDKKLAADPSLPALHLDRWLADPHSRKAILQMYESVGGHPIRPGQTSQRALVRYVKPQLEKAFQRGDLVVLRIAASRKTTSISAQVAVTGPPPKPSPSSTTKPKVKKVVNVEWVETKAYCGNKTTIKGKTENYSDGEVIRTQIKEQTTLAVKAILETKVSTNTFSCVWEFKDLLPTNSGSNYEGRMSLLGSADGKETDKPLVAHFIPNATKTSYVVNRAHFDLSAENYITKIESNIKYLKGWGGSVVDLGASVAPEIGGKIEGLTWPGYRWMKKVGLKHKFWDGTAWLDLPPKFKLQDSNNFCVGFYKNGSDYPCQYGGKWPEAFTDWNIESKPNTDRFNEWKDNIKTTWSNKFDLKRKGCSSGLKQCCRYTVIAKVEFTFEKTFSSGMLIVADGNIRSNDSLWFIAEPRISMAAHEFGHHLGNPDEYAGAKVDTLLDSDGAVKGIDADSIMGQNITKVKRRHFRTVCTHFANIIKSDTSMTYEYEAVPP